MDYKEREALLRSYDFVIHELVVARNVAVRMGKSKWLVKRIERTLPCLRWRAAEILRGGD